MTNYRCPWLLKNATLNTVLPNRFRRVSIAYERERLELSDGDFLDLDWSKVEANRLAVIVHGLESSSMALHVQGMVQKMNGLGWDVVAINLRSCSGEANRLASSYHAGKTDDLLEVLQHVKDRYDQLSLIGFSLGGNLVLVAAGRERVALPANLVGVISISAPCDLAGSSARWQQDGGGMYQKYFMVELKAKLTEKAKRFPELGIQLDDIQKVSNFWEFDDLYTGPVHGFRDAADYYEQSSANTYLRAIKLPTLILNALDDPFLNEGCYPFELANKNPNIHLLVPKYGGHIGFAESHLLDSYWHERMVEQFLQEKVG